MTFRSPNSLVASATISRRTTRRGSVEPDALDATVTAGEDSGPAAHTVICTRPVKAGPSPSQC
jgi:hypothetical protein